MSALHDPRVRGLPLVELALGLRSVIDRFDALLARFAPETVPPGDGELRPGADELSLIVLGAIALRNQIERELSRGEPPPADPEPSVDGDCGELLR